MYRIREHTHLAESLAKWGTLRYVSSDRRVSTYLNADGEEVWLHHGTAVALVYLDDLNWSDMYDDWLSVRGCSLSSTRAFLEHLRGLVLDDEEVSELTICADCYGVVHSDDACGTGDATLVCESCYENYWYCTDCEESYRSTNTINDREVCQRCTDRNYGWCDHCDEYYDIEDGGHDHHREGCCESPAQAFKVRNNGDGLLANDTRTRVGLPAGHISEEGMMLIGQAVRDWALSLRDPGAREYSENKEYYDWHSLSYRLEEIGAQWQTKRGNFTKRLSRFAHIEYALKAPAELISTIGNLGRVHSTGVDFDIEVTRNLNLPREDFAHDGSCWWSEYAESRCALKTNGGFGLRSFVPGSERSDSGTVTGRAWVIPLRLVEGTVSALVETFDTENADAFVVFNGYGVLNNYTPSRIVAHMYGGTYRKIEFTCDAMYINDDTGYLVAPEDIAEHYTDGALELDLADHSNLYSIEQAKQSQSTENCTHFEPCSHNQREHAHV